MAYNSHTAAINKINKSKNNQNRQDSLRNVILFLVVNLSVSALKTSNFIDERQGGCGLKSFFSVKRFLINCCFIVIKFDLKFTIT